MIQVELREISLPFRFRYGHALKQHQDLRAVICTATDEQGRQELGEAVPRSYVTGETCDSILTDFPELTAKLAHTDGDSLAERQAQRVQMAKDWKGAFPSCACCAIDTALESLCARQQGTSLAAQLGASLPQQLQYTASIGVSSQAKLIATLLLYRSLGLWNFKVKVGTADDISRIRWIRRILGKNITLFADANAQWEPEAAIRHIEALAAHDVWAIEEPLRTLAEAPQTEHRVNRFATLTDQHYKQYRWLRDRSPLPLIADESLICLQTAQRIIDQGAFDIFNIRLSKCGGPLLAAEMVRMAGAANLRYSLGAMVGETPILATAGTHFGAAFPDHLYIQGHSHRLLHREQFVRSEPRLQRSGTMVLQPVEGLGLTLDQNALERLTLRIESFQL